VPQRGGDSKGRRRAAILARLEWQHIVDDLSELSEVEVEQDGRRALLRTALGPTIDPICRAIGITLPPYRSNATFNLLLTILGA
jgi:hypothetical protein